MADILTRRSKLKLLNFFGMIHADLGFMIHDGSDHGVSKVPWN